MYFQQKLNALMHLFKLSNSKLARGINVDPSLVSRWKSGERQMSPGSPHIPAIASYFLRLNAYHYQRDFLDQILKQKLNPKDLTSEVKRAHALSEWLIANEPLTLPEMADSTEQGLRSANLIQSLAGLLTTPFKNSQSSLSQPPDPGKIDVATVRHGSLKQHEIYEGHQGLRDAALRLMIQVLQSDQPQEMLLTSEDDITWMIEDPVFLKQWASMLRRILQQGHRITMIHVVNRKPSEIMSAMAHWVPLHLAGNIRSFYHPDYKEQDVRRTLFVIKGQTVVIGYHTGSRDPADLTFYYSDPMSVQHFTRVFHAVLANCKPLFSVFSQRSLKQFLEQLMDIRTTEGAFFNIRQHFNALILTPDLLLKVLPRAAANNLPLRYMNTAIRLHVDAFYESLSTNRTVDILPFGIIEQIRKTRSLPLTSASFFDQEAIYIHGEELVLYLQNLIAVLKTERNYELLFSPGLTELESLQTNIALKENRAALFSSPPLAQPAPYTIMINESNILQSLSFYFEDFIDQIPPALSRKQDVIGMLESLLQELTAGSIL